MFSSDRTTHTSRVLIYLLGLVSIAGLAVIEYFTDAVLSLFVASIVPIVVLTVIGGFPVGVVVSIVSAATWLIIDIILKGGYAELGSPAWNFFIRTTIFLLCTYIFWQINYLRRREHDLVDFVVHDLRTPLTNISLKLDMLRKGECGTLTDPQRRAVEVAEISSRHLAGLINSLLDLSHLENGRAAPQKGEIDLEATVAEAQQHVLPWAQTREVRIRACVAPGAGRCVANGPLLLRILVNLLSNAIKVSPKGATVSVDVAPQGERWIAFVVKDEGEGIPSQLLKKVFDKFEQEGHRVGGGLGLTFCKLAIEAQGGRIWLESEKGKGTSVRFTLPASRQNP